MPISGAKRWDLLLHRLWPAHGALESSAADRQDLLHIKSNCQFEINIIYVTRNR